MGKFIILIICITCIVLIGVLILGASGYTGFRLWQKEWIPQGETDLRFTEIPVNFTHQADLENSLPFMAAAAVDINSDGKDEIFVGGGKGQADAILQFDGSAFVNIAGQFNLSKGTNDATLGAASLDLANDGYPDLLVARESGVWLHMNDGTSFTSQNLNLPLAENTTPLSIAIGDVNRDGWADFYVSGYLKKELVEGETIFSDGYGGFSQLYLNNGDNSWRDVSLEAGVWRQHNTFTAVFTDLDNDGDSDLVIAQDTGLIEMYENPLNETGSPFPFRPISNPSVSSYPMGVAAGDFDNDDDIDLFFSNVGYTLPPPLLRGDLPDDAPFNPEYLLFQNNDALSFFDISKASNTSRLGFGWGVVFADMDLDGHEDLMAAQNYARFPAKQILQKYPAKIMLYSPADKKFHPVEKVAGAKNKHYGISPIISDFNQDGFPDLFWANLGEAPLAYLSQGTGNNWIKVKLPNTTPSLNAIVRVETSDGRNLMKQVMTSQGLGSDQTRELIFGIGPANGATSVSVIYQDGSSIQHGELNASETLQLSNRAQDELDN